METFTIQNGILKLLKYSDMDKLKEVQAAIDCLSVDLTILDGVIAHQVPEPVRKKDINYAARLISARTFTKMAIKELNEALILLSKKKPR